MLNELAIFGMQQPLSSEQKIQNRNQINSIIIFTGIAGIWLTLNPNDLSAPIRIDGGLHRRDILLIQRKVETLVERQRRLFQVKHVNQDPVSSVVFFHQVVDAFFEEIVCVGSEEGGAFGHIDHYFACLETNGRGALHLHGLLWLRGNVGLTEKIDDILHEDPAGKREDFIRFIDTHVSECVD